MAMARSDLRYFDPDAVAHDSGVLAADRRGARVRWIVWGVFAASLLAIAVYLFVV
jgi:hypothetical protein